MKKLLSFCFIALLNSSIFAFDFSLYTGEYFKYSVCETKGYTTECYIEEITVDSIWEQNNSKHKQVNKIIHMDGHILSETDTILEEYFSCWGPDGLYYKVNANGQTFLAVKNTIPDDYNYDKYSLGNSETSELYALAKWSIYKEDSIQFDTIPLKICSETAYKYIGGLYDYYELHNGTCGEMTMQKVRGADSILYERKLLEYYYDPGKHLFTDTVVVYDSANTKLNECSPTFDEIFNISKGSYFEYRHSSYNPGCHSDDIDTLKYVVNKVWSDSLRIYYKRSGEKVSYGTCQSDSAIYSVINDTIEIKREEYRYLNLCNGSDFHSFITCNGEIKKIGIDLPYSLVNTKDCYFKENPNFFGSTVYKYRDDFYAFINGTGISSGNYYEEYKQGTGVIKNFKSGFKHSEKIELIGAVLGQDTIGSVTGFPLTTAINSAKTKNISCWKNGDVLRFNVEALQNVCLIDLNGQTVVKSEGSIAFLPIPKTIPEGIYMLIGDYNSRTFHIKIKI